MIVRKLTPNDKYEMLHLFQRNRYMGVNMQEHSPGRNTEAIAYYMHTLFSNTYLTDLKSYHVFGGFEDGKLVCLIGFYVSTDDASWYWTHVKNVGPLNAIKEVLDAVMEWNESNGYNKFYSMFPLRYQKLYRRLAFSEKNSQRYGAFDEYFVKAKEQCKFNLAWQILYNRRLLPVDTVVRLTYLKPEYRSETNGGNL